MSATRSDVLSALAELKAKSQSLAWEFQDSALEGQGLGRLLHDIQAVIRKVDEARGLVPKPRLAEVKR